MGDEKRVESGTMLLINPPVVRPCEPPAGIARLVGALRGNGVPCRVLDANLEGMMHLLSSPVEANDTWSKRAERHLDSHLFALRRPETYGKIDRYGRSVRDINRLLGRAAHPRGVQVGLANYQDVTLSPLRSSDLIRAAEEPEKNPFYPYFSQRLAEIFEDDQPSVVGISLNYLSQALPAFSLIGLIRRLYPDTRIVLGGGLVTSWLSNPGWRNPFGGLVDDMVAGPGEAPLLGMFGLSSSNGDAVPDYASFRDLPYLSPGFVLPYSASSGCWWGRCTFCPEKAEGSAYTHPPVAEVLSQIEALTAGDRPSLIHFLDNAMSPALLAAMVDHPPAPPGTDSPVSPHISPILTSAEG